MRILLVDGDRSEASVLAGQLGERGHEGCFPDEGNSLGVGVDDPENRPVKSLGCGVTLAVREPSEQLSLREMGAMCAVRRHIRLVEACPNSDSSFSGWSTPTDSAVVDHHSS
jgi:hypothetical protein